MRCCGLLKRKRAVVKELLRNGPSHCWFIRAVFPNNMSAGSQAGEKILASDTRYALQMKCLVSHITAFEYWRLVGLPGIVRPLPTNSQAIPLSMESDEIERLASMGLLSLPLHGATSQKMKNDSLSRFCHYRPESYPRGSIYRIDAETGIVSPELALLQVSSDLSFGELAGIMCEFSGYYSPSCRELHGMIDREPLTNAFRVATYAERAKGLHGACRMRQTAKYALDRARSPMEIAAALLLALPYARGGYALSGMELNNRIKLSVSARKNSRVAFLEPDILWPAARVCIEYDSAEFHGDDYRIANDARRKNAFAISGYKVVTLTKEQIASAFEMDKIAHCAARYLGARLRAERIQGQKGLRHELLARGSALKDERALSDRAGQRFEDYSKSVFWRQRK